MLLSACEGRSYIETNPLLDAGPDVVEVAVDALGVVTPLVEPLEGPVRARPRRQQGRHALVDTRWAGVLRPPD